MSLIEKPGFYNSKAGKCEVVAVARYHSFGYNADSEATIWGTGSGISINKASPDHDILSAFNLQPKHGGKG